MINSVSILEPLLPHIPYLYSQSYLGQQFASWFVVLQKCYLEVSDFYILMTISLKHLTSSKLSNLPQYLFSGFFKEKEKKPKTPKKQTNTRQQLVWDKEPLLYLVIPTLLPPSWTAKAVLDLRKAGSPL